DGTPLPGAEGHGEAVEADAVAVDAEEAAKSDEKAVPAGTGVLPPDPAAAEVAAAAPPEVAPPPPNTGMFFSIYFAMTGLHGIHVIIGIGIYIWLFIRAFKGHFTREY